MAMQKKTIARLIERLPAHTSLYYVDYRDNLNEKQHDALVQKCIEQNSTLPVEEACADWYNDDYEAVRYVINDTYTPEEIERLDNDADALQAIEDAIRERDTSTPALDLIRNTGDRYFFYSLGISASEGDASEPEHVREIMRQLKAAGIKTTRRDVLELLQNAFYGGTIGILWRADSFALVDDRHEYKYVKIGGGALKDGPRLACIDYMNGSGYDIPLESATLPLAGCRDKIGIERYYVEDVCGMVLNDSAVQLLEPVEHAGEPEPVYSFDASSIGNIIADDIAMLHVRSWNETRCNGQRFERGHLYRFDIEKRDAPAHVLEALKMRGGWLAKIKRRTATANYFCGWVAFDKDGRQVLARKIESDHEYVNAYIDHIIKGSAASRGRIAGYKKAAKARKI